MGLRLEQNVVQKGELQDYQVDRLLMKNAKMMDDWNYAKPSDSRGEN